METNFPATAVMLHEAGKATVENLMVLHEKMLLQIKLGTSEAAEEWYKMGQRVRNGRLGYICPSCQNHQLYVNGICNACKAEECADRNSEAEGCEDSE